VELASALPPGLTFKANSGDCTSGFPCSLHRLAAGASKTVTTSACVARDYSGSDPVAFTASATSATTDPIVANNTANATSPLISEGFADGFDCAQ
jgi:hypothetical protein